LRLAVVSPFVDRQHGTERALAELLEGLAFQHNCKIHLYSERIEGLRLQQSETADPTASGSITWHKIPSLGGPHLVQFLAWVLLNTLYRVWDKKIGGLKFDAILSPGINCFDADFVIVHALFHKLKELSEHRVSTTSSVGFLKRWHRNAYYRLLSALERRIYSNPSVQLATVSERTRALISGLFHRPDVALIPNAVNSQEFSPEIRQAGRAEARKQRGYSESDLVLLFIGNDWGVKGLPCLLEALRDAATGSLRLLAVGSEDPSQYIEKAKQWGIERRIQFDSPKKNVLDLYAAADVYVSPSLEDSFGLPVLEAMACGLPVVTSPLAGVSEVVSNGIDGIVMQDPKDAQELKEVLEELAVDAEHRQKIGTAGAVRARRCSWEQNSAMVYSLLQASVAKKNAGKH
jgi:glycosyltransferase involved in cell wall biosynthesis